MKMPSEKIILCGSTCQTLAKELSKSTKIPVAFINLIRFPDGEIKPIVPVEILRGREVFYLASTYKPAENVLEFLFTINTLERIRTELKKINVLVMWFGYGRQDRADIPGAPLSAHYLVSKIPEDFNLTIIDFHNPRAFPLVKNIIPYKLFGDFILKKYKKILNKTQAIALDKNAYKKTNFLSSYLSLPYPPVQIEKERDPYTNKVTIKGIKGELKGKTLILFDDIISGGSILKEINFLKEKIKAEIILVITHPCFFLNEKTNIGEVLKEIKILLTTNSISQTQKITSKIKIISLSSLLKEII